MKTTCSGRQHQTIKSGISQQTLIVSFSTKLIFFPGKYLFSLRNFTFYSLQGEHCIFSKHFRRLVNKIWSLGDKPDVKIAWNEDDIHICQMEYLSHHRLYLSQILFYKKYLFRVNRTLIFPKIFSAIHFKASNVIFTILSMIEPKKHSGDSLDYIDFEGENEQLYKGMFLLEHISHVQNAGAFLVAWYSHQGHCNFRPIWRGPEQNRFRWKNNWTYYGKNKEILSYCGKLDIWILWYKHFVQYILYTLSNEYCILCLLNWKLVPFVAVSTI